ncbi:MAG TPA: class I SAM-dependent methyltransferase, partial [Methylophilaceae bacterium]|nr:class I SAM-dependent methyltransferase [Methylophilaceae bacterium]
GQGLLTAWLLAAQTHAARGHWPEGWPPPPQPASIHRIELMARDQQRARKALGHYARFTHGNISHTDFGEADTIVILDVLHYIDYASQQDILRRAHATLPPHGVLLLRIGDAGGGLRYKMSAGYDRVIWKLRGARHSRLYCRTLPEWRETLHRTGFSSKAVPIHHGLRLANTLLVAKPLISQSARQSAKRFIRQEH